MIRNKFENDCVLRINFNGYTSRDSFDPTANFIFDTVPGDALPMSLTDTIAAPEN